MAGTTSHPVAGPPTAERSRGRLLAWTGLGLCLLGVVLAIAQFATKRLGVPWYAPALATLGAVLLLVATVQRVTVVRILALVGVAGFAGLQWFFLASMMKLPDYQGPAQAGKQLPAFESHYADGRTLAEADLHDGKRRVLVFFRGRW